MNLRRAALLAAGATALLAAPGIASASAGDPLGCSPAVFDPGDDVDAAALAPLIDAAERTLDAEIQVRVEQVVDGGLDDRIGQLVAQCPGWEEGTNELADDRIVVMFSPTERESALYYGANHADTLDDGWESVVDAMTSDLRAGDYDGAAEAAMRRLRAVTAESSTSAADDSGPGFPTGWLVLIGAVGIVGVIYQLYRGGTAGEGTDGGSDVEQRVVTAPALVQQLVVVPQQLEWRRRPLELTQLRARRRRLQEVVTVADLGGLRFSWRT